MASFDEAIKKLFRLEGGYVFDPDDPGGETKYGISKRWNPTVDIKNLKQADAEIIYRQEWWNRYGYSKLKSQAIATDLLCLAVNIGPLEAHKILQRALNAFGAMLIIDGVIGPMTIAAEGRVYLSDALSLSYLFKLEAVRYYCHRKNSNIYLRGWIARVV